jgi:glyoxylase-like metal-dependent hydrolase (beta-lactamase superfamily II)
MAGVRIPPSNVTRAPTPPPDIDVEAWLESVDRIEARSPSAVVLTHFGRVDDVGGQLAAVRDALRFQADLAKDGSEDEFVAELERIAAQDGIDAGTGERFYDAGNPHDFYAGLRRYWSKVAT